MSNRKNKFFPFFQQEKSRLKITYTDVRRRIQVLKNKTSGYLHNAGLLVFFVLIAQDMFGQQSNAGNGSNGFSSFVYFGKNFVKDETFSNVVYQGPVAAGAIKYFVEKKHSVQTIYAMYAAGRMSMMENKENILNQKMLDVNYENVFKMNPSAENSTEVFLGAAVDVLYAKRNFSNFINRTSSYNPTAVLAAAGRVRHNFEPADLALTWDIQIPFFAMIDQPAFDNQQAANDLKDNGYSLSHFFKNANAGSFESFTRFKSDVSIDKKIAANQFLSLSYCWDYYKLNKNPSVRQASHLFGITYKIILQ